MSRKRTLPGVDEKALASLAHMFPAAGAADAIKVAHPSPPPNGTTKTAAPIVVPDEALPTQSADRPVDSTPLVETRSAPEVHAEPALQNDDDTAEEIGRAHV